MPAIQNKELVEAAVGRWHAGDVAWVSAVHLREDATLVLTALMQRRDHALKGWPARDLPVHQVTMEFGGVRDLSLLAPGGLPVQIGGFDIEDCSDAQMEGIAFRVSDYEHGRLSFACSTIRVASVAAATHP
ncbi:MAG TPA: hypothetical protein VD997_01675 [Phycisphaerales bacterium]|nr:hypothetical protein [Phycisphaerales bacterium]